MCPAVSCTLPFRVGHRSVGHGYVVVEQRFGMSKGELDANSLLDTEDVR
jgi:hypothetical protein